MGYILDNIVHWISWVCFATTCLSIWFNGERRLLGPFFGMVGFIPWSLMAYLTEQWGILAVSFIVLTLQARSFVLWKKDNLKWI